MELTGKRKNNIFSKFHTASKKEIQELKDKLSKDSFESTKLLQSVTTKDSEIQNLKSEIEKFRSSASNGKFLAI